VRARGDAYLVLLDFPAEDEGDPNLDWLRCQREGIERLCDDHCFRMGNFCVLPEPYFSSLDNLLRKARGEYRARGYAPLFRILRVSFPEAEYAELRWLMLDGILARLEGYLKVLDGENPCEGHDLSDVVQRASRDLIKAGESVLLFQLDKAFPGRVNELYDLIDILSEEVADREALALGPVVVRRVEG